MAISAINPFVQYNNQSQAMAGSNYAVPGNIFSPNGQGVQQNPNEDIMSRLNKIDAGQMLYEKNPAQEVSSTNKQAFNPYANEGLVARLDRMDAQYQAPEQRDAFRGNNLYCMA